MTYLAPSTGLAVRAVLFDVFGTVVDWRSGIAAAAGSFAARHGLELDGPAFADSWRGRYQPAMQQVRSGSRPFVPLDVLHRENLDDALREHGLDPAGFAPAELDGLTRAWHFLPPWPDSVAGIAAIKRGYIVGPLSNGNTSLLLDMAKAAALPWDLILGADVSRAYKPAPEAYLRPTALLGLAPGEVMLAAAHESDLAAAREAGLAAAFVARPLEYGPRAAPAAAPAADWDLAAPSITELAGHLRVLPATGATGGILPSGPLVCGSLAEKTTWHRPGYVCLAAGCPSGWWLRQRAGYRRLSATTTRLLASRPRLVRSDQGR